MINFKPLFIILGLMTAAASVGGCFVHPTSVVVTVGERAILQCTTYQGESITSWYIQIDEQRTTVYIGPIYKPGGIVRRPAEIAQGYFVTHHVDNEATLQMNETILSQAGLYICTCNNQRNKAESTVAVLDSEPKFSKNCSTTYGEPITFSCSISFNASSEVTCELKIANASGSTVATGNVATYSGGLIKCSLKHTIIAIVSSDQWHTCHVTLSTKDRCMIYSRVLNAVVELEPGDSTSDFSLGDVGMIFNSSALEHREEGGRPTDAYQVLAFPITLTVACIVIAILTATTVVLYRKPRERKRNTSDVKNIYTEDCPAQYAALDAQMSSDERQQQPYTEICLQIQPQQGQRRDMNTYIRNEYEDVA